MNKTCCKILLSTLPWCITTRTALLSIPFGACNSSYIYRMITDLIDRKYLAERNVVTKIDGRKYSHSYLSLTKNGLTALVDCYSANREIAIGSICQRQSGTTFLPILLRRHRFQYRPRRTRRSAQFSAKRRWRLISCAHVLFLCRLNGPRYNILPINTWFLISRRPIRFPRLCLVPSNSGWNHIPLISNPQIRRGVILFSIPHM